MINRVIQTLIAGLLLSVSLASYALLEVHVLKSAQNAYPVAVMTFDVKEDITLDQDIAAIIRANLARSGRFKAVTESGTIATKSQINFTNWRKKNVDAIVIGSVEKNTAQTYRVQFRLYDVYTKSQLSGKSWIVRKGSLRRVAHKISDEIYFKLLGEKGDFDTHLSYITVKKNEQGQSQYYLEVADSDAYNPQTVLVTKEPILSPAWSPDGQRLAYVSFEEGYSQVYVKYIWVRRQREKLPKFEGIASAPTWSPDGEHIALTLSKDGNKDIYLYTLKTKQLKRLTYDVATDTEANFSPDGRYILFSSNRANGVQIYRLTLDTGDVKRLTFKGSYNAKPVYSPNGHHVVFVHRDGGSYRIGLLELATNTMSVISNGRLDESPYFSPNGSMIIHASQRKNKGFLSVISTDGLNSHQLMSTEGEVREPSWSSF